MTKLSIIIPIYNNATYLKQCLNSITAQNFNDFEILCINDASTDNSTAILNSLAAEDSRIRILIYRQHKAQELPEIWVYPMQKANTFTFWTVMIGWNQTYTRLCSPKLNKTAADICFFQYNRIYGKITTQVNLFTSQQKQNKSRVFMDNPKFFIRMIWRPISATWQPCQNSKPLQQSLLNISAPC